MVGEAPGGEQQYLHLPGREDAVGAFLGLDGRPESVKNFASYTLQRLGVEMIDLYQAGRPDPDVPYEETVGTLEIEYSLACRFIEPEILPTARELGVGIVPYRVLADGLLSGAITGEPTGDDRSYLPPRLTKENVGRNVATASFLKKMADDKGHNSARTNWPRSTGPSRPVRSLATTIRPSCRSWRHDEER